MLPVVYCPGYDFETNAEVLRELSTVIDDLPADSPERVFLRGLRGRLRRELHLQYLVHRRALTRTRAALIREPRSESLRREEAYLESVLRADSPLRRILGRWR